jgi:beta-lactamase class A
MRWTRSWQLVAALATLLIASTSPPQASAQSDPAPPTECDGTSPIDSQRVTWEYSPPALDSTTPHLMCVSQTIATLIDEAVGDWGVAVRDLRTRETLLANPDRHFVAGSLYKLGVAAEAYARINAGSLAEESIVVVSEQDADPEYGGSMYGA